MELEHLSFTADCTSPRAGHAHKDETCAPEQLGRLEWVPQLCKAPNSKLVFTSTDKLSGLLSAADLSADHLFLALLKMDLITEMLVVYDDEQQIIHNIVQLGIPVCGHPTIVHGGLTSAIFDETFGALLYAMKRRGHMELEKVYTAHLGVDYKKPLPAATSIMCTAKVDCIEKGRKIWLSAQVLDRPGGTVYATSRSLFIKVAKEPQPVQAADTAQADGHAA